MLERTGLDGLGIGWPVVLLPLAIDGTLQGPNWREKTLLCGFRDNLTQTLGVIKKSSLKTGGGRQSSRGGNLVSGSVHISVGYSLK